MSVIESQVKQSTNVNASNSNTGFMVPSSIEEAMKISKYIAESSICPKNLAGRPGDVMITLQMGAELGLKPMQALQNIAVINGRPSVWGDAMLAICRQSPDFEFIKEEFDPKTMTATCIVKRRNEPEFIKSFSKEQAVRAKLWGKQGPWTDYPERMLQMRARGFNLRDAFPDLLRGIIIREEAEDMPRERTDWSKSAGRTIEGEVVTISTIDEEQAVLLKEKIKEAGSEESSICSFLKIETLEDMTQPDWSEVMRMLDKKLSKKRKGVSFETQAPATEEPEPEMSQSAKEFFGEE